MEKISNLIDVNKLLSGEEKMAHEKTHYETQTAKIVNHLFGELKLIFPAFRQAWATDEEFSKAKSVWTKALKENGISNIGMIKRALKKCRTSTNPFAPSVGQFIAWCMPDIEDLKFPDVLQAHKISLRMNEIYSQHKESNEHVDKLIRHVINQIGPNTYRKLTEKESYKMFGHYYTVAIRHLANGELQETPKAIEGNSDTPEEQKKKSEATLPKYVNLSGYEEAMTKMKEMLN